MCATEGARLGSESKLQRYTEKKEKKKRIIWSRRPGSGRRGLQLTSFSSVPEGGKLAEEDPTGADFREESTRSDCLKALLATGCREVGR